jgi:hypothetical protein
VESTAPSVPQYREVTQYFPPGEVGSGRCATLDLVAARRQAVTVVAVVVNTVAWLLASGLGASDVRRTR